MNYCSFHAECRMQVKSQNKYRTQISTKNNNHLYSWGKFWGVEIKNVTQKPSVLGWRNLINDLEQFRPIKDKNLSEKLLRSFTRFKNKAVSIDNNSDSVNILQWHHDICRFTCESDTDDLWAWYEACKLVVLVLPSSGASERVFSLLKQYWGIQQTHSLLDIIMLYLYLSYNKRHVRDFIGWKNIIDCF